MTTEPLTVEELERYKELAWAFIKKHRKKLGFGGLAAIDLAADLTELLESHSRQLWLEAERYALEELADCKVTGDEAWCVAHNLAIVFRDRAKAESTPKPSPALPREEK